MKTLPLAIMLALIFAVATPAPAEQLRVATFNVENLTADAPVGRVDLLARYIRCLSADVILINEVDTPPDDLRAAVRPLVNAINKDLPDDRHYTAVVRPTNTGEPSGHDLDNNGAIINEPGTREYGGDALGFGEYPGQYGMALLVRAPFVVDEPNVRSFAQFLWKDMPRARLPITLAGEDWYTADELDALRLSSKTMMDVPVITPSGARVHMICAHPTPPVFDGAEDRNGTRNHDEIRLIADYLSGKGYLYDDEGSDDLFPHNALFVVLGDMNADPDEGDSTGNPIRLLLDHERIKRVPAPISNNRDRADRKLDPDDTARFGLRADYVLPSKGFIWTGGGIIESFEDINAPDSIVGCFTPRSEPQGGFPSDHYPVVVDLLIIENAPDDQDGPAGGP